MYKKKIGFQNNKCISRIMDDNETNKISTTLYNRYTFLPLGLWN